MFWLPIDRNQNMSLIRQVYEQIRHRILNGDLSPGLKLPSTRNLAETLHVSRIVILEAYEQLTAEGYMTSARGSGTYVAEGACWRHSPPPNYLETETHPVAETTPEAVLIDFCFGVPALDLFPKRKWSQVFNQVCSSSPPAVFGYGAPEGHPELRQVLARYLIRSRGVYCQPEQVIITTGAIQAIHMVAKLLLNSDETVITEDPLNINVRKIFMATGARLLPIPVDQQGIITSHIPADVKPKIVYITPSHQFPLGTTLSIQRRIELAEIARRTGCYILEDNYDNEFRFAGTPVSSLQGLEPESVIYVGTFSKILSPSLRIGYMVVPHNLIKALQEMKNLFDHHSPSLNQLVLAQFIEQGYFERHVSKMKKIYRQRQETIIKCLHTHFSERCSVSGHSTGLHLIVEFKEIIFSEQLVSALEEAGVRVYPLERYAVNQGCYANKILLGYGNVNEAEIMAGIKIMKDVIG